MRQRVRWLCFAVVSLTLAACSGADHPLPQRTGQRQLGGQNDAPPRIVNVFAAARNKNLSDKDLCSAPGDGDMHRTGVAYASLSSLKCWHVIGLQVFLRRSFNNAERCTPLVDRNAPSSAAEI